MFIRKSMWHLVTLWETQECCHLENCKFNRISSFHISHRHVFNRNFAHCFRCTFLILSPLFLSHFLAFEIIEMRWTSQKLSEWWPNLTCKSTPTVWISITRVHSSWADPWASLEWFKLHNTSPPRSWWQSNDTTWSGKRSRGAKRRAARLRTSTSWQNLFRFVSTTFSKAV